MKSDSKLDQLCDFTEQEKTVEKFRKFQNEVSPSSTFKVDDNWRMVPMKDLYPQKFRISGLTRQAKCDEGDSKVSARALHVFKLRIESLTSTSISNVLSSRFTKYLFQEKLLRSPNLGLSQAIKTHTTLLV